LSLRQSFFACAEEGVSDRLYPKWQDLNEDGRVLVAAMSDRE